MHKYTWAKMLLLTSIMPSGILMLNLWHSANFSASIVLGGVLHGMVGLVDIGPYYIDVARHAIIFMVGSFFMRLAIFVSGCLYLQRCGYSMPVLFLGYFTAHIIYVYSKISIYNHCQGDMLCPQN